MGSLVEQWQACTNIIVSAACFEYPNATKIVMVTDNSYDIHIRRFANPESAEEDSTCTIQTGLEGSKVNSARNYCSSTHCLAVVAHHCFVINSQSLKEVCRFDFISGKSAIKVTDTCFDAKNNDIVVLTEANALLFFNITSGELQRTILLKDKHDVKRMKGAYSLSVVPSNGDIHVNFMVGVIAWHNDGARDVTDTIISPEHMRGDVINNSDDGTRVLMFDDNYIHVWDTRAHGLLVDLYTESTPSFATLSSDGQYIVYVTADRKTIKLLRVNDSSELASYVMYSSVYSLAVSRDSCFVLLGTEDRRLFVLAIVDPDVSEHRKRLSELRSSPALLEQNKKLVDESRGQTIDDLKDDGEDDELENLIMAVDEFEDDNLSDADMNVDLYQSGALKRYGDRPKERNKRNNKNQTSPKGKGNDSPSNAENHIDKRREKKSPNINENSPKGKRNDSPSNPENAKVVQKSEPPVDRKKTAVKQVQKPKEPSKACNLL